MFLSVVYFMTALLGFLTLMVLVSQYKSNRKVNFYLLILIFFASFRFFFIGIFSLVFFTVSDDVTVIFHSFGSGIFACIYLYFKCLVANRKNPVAGDLYYFSIPVLFGIYNLWMRYYAASWYLLSYFLFALIPLFYLGLSFFELKNKLWFQKSKTWRVQKQNMLVRNWSIFFFVFCFLIVLRLLVSLVLDIFVAGYSDGTSYFWLAALLCFALFFRLLFTPMMLYSNVLLDCEVKSEEYFELVFEDFWLDESDVLITNSQDLKLSERVESNLESYIYEIERMALEHFCFRNPKVSMRDFAIRLEIPKSHLLYFFKYHSKVSFIEFKRTVRIYDAISLIEEGFLEKRSVEKLSKKTGFCSCDLFLSSFKEIVGVEPQEYNQKRKELC